MELDPEEWLAAHGDALFRYALAHTGRRDVAEDLVQETLLAAWRGRDQFRGGSGERTWLFGILKHKVDDHFRREARPDRLKTDVDPDEVLEDDDAFFDEEGSWRTGPGSWADNPLSQLEAEQFWAVLNRCIQALPERLRDGFVLRELSALDVGSVCRTLDVNENHLYVLLHRARLRMRECLEKHWFQTESKK